MAKFAVPVLAEILRATGTARLVEGNEHYGNFWVDRVCASLRARRGA